MTRATIHDRTPEDDDIILARLVRLSKAVEQRMIACVECNPRSVYEAAADYIHFARPGGTMRPLRIGDVVRLHRARAVGCVEWLGRDDTGYPVARVSFPRGVMLQAMVGQVSPVGSVYAPDPISLFDWR